VGGGGKVPSHTAVQGNCVSKQITWDSGESKAQVENRTLPGSEGNRNLKKNQITPHA
jgi:hypothetical protein